MNFQIYSFFIEKYFTFFWKIGSSRTRLERIKINPKPTQIQNIQTQTQRKKLASTEVPKPRVGPGSVKIGLHDPIQDFSLHSFDRVLGFQAIRWSNLMLT